MLDWITTESGMRYIQEISPEFENYLNGELTTKFIDLNDNAIEDELQKLERESITSSSKRQMDYHVKKFRDFLKENNLSENFEFVSNIILNKYLRYFYAKIRSCHPKLKNHSSNPFFAQRMKMHGIANPKL